MIRNTLGDECHELFTTEDGSWKLVRVDMPLISSQIVKAFHEGCHGLDGDEPMKMDPFHDSSWFLDEEPICWTCDHPVPQEIQTLFLLHEYGAGTLDATTPWSSTKY
jgi:hypothetical protein